MKLNKIPKTAVIVTDDQVRKHRLAKGCSYLTMEEVLKREMEFRGLNRVKYGPVEKCEDSAMWYVLETPPPTAEPAFDPLVEAVLAAKPAVFVVSDPDPDVRTFHGGSRVSKSQPSEDQDKPPEKKPPKKAKKKD